ncbi:Flp pilus assembly protein CpaB [Salipiger marinus]|uniref:Flp pilus assembly protein CpaB n=1 Tax=Salipiger marinus TaxID=555512 RepID=UPI000E9D84C5|nr:Flp pilus assembly protein CpaB [Salipiger manganoxidans]MCD1619621.1 Flp pilus assembly protein CpaB [Salipiger manganoxidans]MEB3419415.1 Flp pilus assembly protein CpaB [Salipiger manganoxidans]HBT00232.1 Flp pilus assembly protein CpaB [Citreicella sp.]
MRLVFGLVLIAGLGLAGFAVYMAQNYINAYQTALQQEREKAGKVIPTAEIYVTTRAIAHGEVVTDADVRLAPWPQEILPEGTFGAERPLFAEGEAPRVALRAIEKFEAVQTGKISEPGGDAGLTSRLQPGQRAFAIKVDVHTGVSGFLRPGDRVDIYWTGRVGDGGRGQGEITKLIETGVKLIAVDQTAELDSTDVNIARSVTVAASPQQVASLAQAQSTGRLSLSLMGVNETIVAEAIEVDQRALLGLDMVVPQAAPVAPVTCTTRVRRGSEVVDIPIPCTN